MKTRKKKCDVCKKTKPVTHEWKSMAITFMIISFVVLMFILLVAFQRDNALREVEVLRKKIPHWELEVVCSSTNATSWSLGNYWDTSHIQMNFSSYDAYEETIESYKEISKSNWVDCEVIE